MLTEITNCFGILNCKAVSDIISELAHTSCLNDCGTKDLWFGHEGNWKVKIEKENGKRCSLLMVNKCIEVKGTLMMPKN